MAVLLFLLFMPILSTESTTAQPIERDVIGQYALANEKQCNRLCWYRQFCTSYSYNSKTPPSPLTSAVYNCILHTDSVISSKAMGNLSTKSADWAERPISTSPVNNGCQSRPCNGRELCVPASSSRMSTSSKPASYVCISLPSECRAPPAVSHGQVIVSGSSQDDIAHVMCDENSVASPKNASLTMSCLVTSAWSAMEGECVQFKYETNDGNMMRLPWRLEENSKICIRGTLDSPWFSIDFWPESYSIKNIAQLRFGKYDSLIPPQFLWNTMEDGVWHDRGTQTPISLTSGDNFSVMLHVLNNELEVVLNDKTYLVPINVNKAPFILINNIAGPLHVNLISGC